MDWLNKFSLCLLNFFLIHFIELHKGMSFPQRIFHNLKLFTFFGYSLILLKFLHHKLLVLFFHSRVHKSLTWNISTEHVIIRPNFLSSFCFQLGSITSFSSNQWNQSLNTAVTLNMIKRFDYLSLRIKAIVIKGYVQRKKKRFDLLEKVILVRKKESLPWEFEEHFKRVM